MHTPSRRFLLRERTARLHALVDSAVGSFETLEEYRHYVAGIHRFRDDMEGVTGDFVDEGGWRPRRIAHLAALDLQDLGLSPLPAVKQEPVTDTPSGRLGALYVLEGATLGARILHQRARTLGLSAEHGARHLAAQAQGVENWRGFLDLLDRAAPFDLEAAVDGAERVFRHAVRAFDREGRIAPAS